LASGFKAPILVELPVVLRILSANRDRAIIESEQTSHEGRLQEFINLAHLLKDLSVRLADLQDDACPPMAFGTYEVGRVGSLWLGGASSGLEANGKWPVHL
jgi:hypothetical protein